MKMVKSLLLGTAAGLVAMTGAQAADLPVKAKPVQYVKICSLYGAGFYYIPGTDMCLKMGGWVRAEYAYGDNGNMTWGWANNNVNNRTTNDSTWRSRGYITADARNQTEYGTVRSYIAVGLNSSSVGVPDGGIAFSSNRAFIQFAGFTFGLSSSFYDFYSVPATAYWGSYPASDTGDPGWQVAAYTAQFGGGMSATIAAEMRRLTYIQRGVYTNVSAAQAIGANVAGFQAPDIVANLRIDQAWGSAQVMGALHQVSSLYYGATSPTGHPDDKWGFALGAGIKLLAPAIAPGDYFQAQVNYTEGASRYAMFTSSSNWANSNGSIPTAGNDFRDAGFGALTDAVYGGTVGAPGVFAATDLQLTTAWGFNAAYEHFWSKQWRTSVYGGYTAVSYNDTANNLMCTGVNLPFPNCDMDWSTWFVGSRTQYNIDASTYLGLDVMYAKLQSADWGIVGAMLHTAITPNGIYQKADMDNWQFRFRVHRDFYP